MAEGDSLHSASISLQSNDTRNLLDIVDNLRSHGISRYIDLPEIIVCGEQSSGKSSVLEAVSGVRFPSKDNLCTRFATELILRRGPVLPIKIRIVPGSQEERSEAEKEKLLNFHVSVSAEDLQLGDIIESAKDAMGINDSTKVFSSDILRLELSGPEQPHLTLVDLPGLFQAGSRSQSDADSETVKSLVLSYMKSPRSIILAVVSAKNDFNNQSITKYSRAIDPNGVRTLGLITKPDTLDEGSDSERFYIELAQNKDVKFRLGWHVLRNRDYSTRDSSAQDRNNAEAQFFASGVWRSLPPAQTGVHSLKPRLSKILKDHILAQLPDVLTQIQDGILDCTKRLDTLGASRATVQEQRRYLLHVSHSFSTLIKAAIDGQYSDPFFGDASNTEGYQKRLRAVLQNTLTDFAEVMRKKGHRCAIIDEGFKTHDSQITRSDYISKVKTLLERSRGRELPGTFDPLIVGQLFHEQREPWTKLVNEHMNIVVRAVYFVVRTALTHVSDHYTLEGLLRQFIFVRLEDLTIELRNKVKELLQPHDTGHPITYNHYLTENVQKAQGKRRAHDIKKSLEDFFGADYTTDGFVNININVNQLIDTLAAKTEADMNNYASSTATDFMEAYYKVALKKIIDDFSVLAVETCLVQKLPTLFCPADIIDIDDTTVSALASEDEESSAERAQCDEKLKILEDGLRALQSVQEYPLALKEPAVLQNMISGGTELEEKHPNGVSSTDCSSKDLIAERTASLLDEAPPPEAAPPLEDDGAYFEMAPVTENEWDALMPASVSKKKKKRTQW
ncbi:dynamin family protein [Cucurbitaria berberidis CBS 394.84]|uniref:Dynamin family protein n=1 Tax=Cucurbitaria berberidis CBS 394.84 TaxID=1168544 RepID=A0A9P4GSK3_9PLEO|nr:dynamin family protein [Cucurbitaria berberidis CBS 394.84]KAF1850557.1 dynamin family protein [Cucurbitaria berberidis CBS 394.84]